MSVFIKPDLFIKDPMRLKVPSDFWTLTAIVMIAIVFVWLVWACVSLSDFRMRGVNSSCTRYPGILRSSSR
jgi:hypothetical protein